MTRQMNETMDAILFHRTPADTVGVALGAYQEEEVQRKKCGDMMREAPPGECVNV